MVEEGTLPPVPLNPCDPPPCGPHSQCQVVSGQAECSCLAGKIGRVPNCRPECTVSSDCFANEACVGQKCVDPCPGSCAPNAECRVVNHSPVCTCRPGYSGDAYIQCNIIVVQGECCVAFRPHLCHFTNLQSALILTCWYFVVETPVRQPDKPRPCDPSPCGQNAQCREQNGQATCLCPSDYVGDPYVGCGPECVLNPDCPKDKSCVRNKCVDPCPGTCGLNADCRVSNHIVVCTCLRGFSGDPYSSCRPIAVICKEHLPTNRFVVHLNGMICMNI